MSSKALERLAAEVYALRGKLTQEEFAKILGVGQSTIQAWERASNMPSLKNLEKLAQRRGVLVEEFVAQLYGRSLAIKRDLEELGILELTRIIEKATQRIRELAEEAEQEADR